MVRTTWRRTYRSPEGLFYVALPLTLVLPATVSAYERWPAVVPGLVALYAAAAIAVGPTLNALGNERRTLPLVRSVPNGHVAVLRGYAVAVLVPGGPLAVGATVVAGAITGLTPIVALGFGVVAGLLAVAGVGVSLGIGIFLPNVSRLEISTLTAPTVYAMTALLIAMTLLATPALASVRIADGPAAAGAAILGTAVGGGVAGLAGYRYAVGRLEAYELER